MKEQLHPVFVIGHKNPDTDSICAALSYTWLKNTLSERYRDQAVPETYVWSEDAGPAAYYVPRRAGQLSPETQYLLTRFETTPPPYTSDMRVQVRDVSIRRVEGISETLSLKDAWQIMRTVNIATLPILDEEGRLKGLITTGDIARSYMEVFDDTLLSKSRTTYANILDVLNGEAVVPGQTETVSEGSRTFIAAASPDTVHAYTRPGDVVILGNRYETQLSAIEAQAGCLIICNGAPVSRTIRKLAQDSGCVVITTDFDTYTVARLINQSVPVSYFMRRDGLVTFKKDDYISEIKGTMLKKRHRDFPVLDRKGRFAGMISRRSLIDMPQKKLILVDHNEADQAVDGLEEAQVLEIVDHHKLGTVETIKPVMVRNQPVGCTNTIIYQMALEYGVDIPKNVAGLMCGAILSDTLLFRSPTCTQDDIRAAEALAEIAGIDPTELATEMFTAGSNLSGKTDDEVFFQDFKRFTVGSVTFGVGQIMSMTENEQMAIRERMVPYIAAASGSLGVDMIFLMLTNIVEESTLLLCSDADAAKTALAGFSMDDSAADIDSVLTEGLILPGIVSRKKQMIPKLMTVLQRRSEE